MFHVEIDGEYGDKDCSITLVDRHEFTLSPPVDDELIHWISDEWREDPSLVVVIANAIRIGYTEGPDAIRERLKK